MLSSVLFSLVLKVFLGISARANGPLYAIAEYSLRRDAVQALWQMYRLEVESTVDLL
jgi:hypothetical protein